MVNTEVKLIIVFAAEDGETLYTQQNPELTVAQTMSSLLQTSGLNEDSRENHQTIQYDLNHIPYDYTVDISDRFKGSDLIDRVAKELWTEVCDIVHIGGSDQDYPQEKEMQKGKMIV